MNGQMPELSWEDKIAYLAWKVSQNGGTKAEDIEVRHIFEKGLYIREFDLPPAFVFFGRIHRKGHLVVLLRGSANLITPQGTTVHHAIDRMMTPANFQTVACTITACLVRSVHPNPNESRNVEELEDEYFAPVQSTLVKGQGIQERLWLEQ